LLEVGAPECLGGVLLNYLVLSLGTVYCTQLRWHKTTWREAGRKTGPCFVSAFGWNLPFQLVTLLSRNLCWWFGRTFSFSAADLTERWTTTTTNLWGPRRTDCARLSICHAFGLLAI